MEVKRTKAAPLQAVPVKTVPAKVIPAKPATKSSPAKPVKLAKPTAKGNK